jgi:hypothetical protein
MQQVEAAVGQRDCPPRGAIAGDGGGKLSF